MNTRIDTANTMMPAATIVGIIIVCMLPMLLTLFGADFGNRPLIPELSGTVGQTGYDLTEHFRILSGFFTHTILEWSAFCAAIFTFILAIVHNRITGDHTTPIIATALLCAGGMDAVHTLAADQLIGSVADSNNLIPFTWTISRAFHALILVVGVAVLLLLGDRQDTTSTGLVIGVGTFFLILAFLFLDASFDNRQLPQTMFPDSIVKRPWDVGPLILYLLAGLWLFPMYYRKFPGLFAFSLILCMVPNVATQLHMAFGSTRLFDNHFNIAHFLKIIAYLVPFTGLLLDYIRTHAGRRHDQKLIDEAETRTSAFLETAIDGVISIDQHGQITLFNRAAEEIFGYTRDEVLGKSINMLMSAPDRDQHDSHMRRYMNTQQVNILGKRRVETGRRKDGTTFPMELSVTDTSHGGMTGFTGIMRDVTEQKRMQEELLARQSELDNFLNHAPVMMWMTDADGHATLFNDSWLEFTGRTFDDEISHDWQGDLIHPDDRPACLETYHECMLKHKRIQHVYRMQNSAGVYRWISEVGVPRFSSDNYFEGYIGTCIDVTEKKLADMELSRRAEALAQSEQVIKAQKDYFETLIDSLGAPIFVIDRDHKVITWNRACEELTGLAAADVIGTDRHWDGFYRKPRPCLADLVIDEDYSGADAWYPEKFANIELVKGGKFSETWCDMKDGKRVYLMVFANPVLDADGNVIAAVEFVFDMTDLKKSSQKMQEQQEELERSNRELEQFAYVASHDLQEPLRMVASYTGLLGKRYKGKLDKDADDFINYAIDGAHRMQNLIQDLLEFSRVGTRQSPFETVDCNLVCQEVIDNLQVVINETGTRITRENLPQVYADPNQVRQVFQNLVSNAVKYRDPDKKNTVHISSESENGSIRFCIEDNGIGIEPKYFERIFIIFKRLHDTSVYKGTGIGLAICKRIIESHQGCIWLESEPGHGSRFYFTLSKAGKRKRKVN